MKKEFERFAVAAGVAALVVSAPAVTLTKDGTPAAVVVIPKNPRPVEKYAAEELVRFVRKASGAELKVAHSPVAGMDSVLIGRAVRLPGWGGQDGFEPNGGLVNILDHALELVGGDNDAEVGREGVDAGSLFAVYEFLERELKVRWLWPDDEIGVVVRPRLTICIAPKRYGFRPVLSDNVSLRAFPDAWALRTARVHHKMWRFPVALSGGHIFGKWWETYGKTHPDFFEMDKNGDRIVGGSSSMCVSNPKFEAELYRLWKVDKDANPAYRYDMNLCENDTAGRCQCPNCRAWDDPDAPKGNVSERYCRHYLNMYNLLSKDDPNVRLQAYAYKNYDLAPKGFKLVRNIHIGYVPRPFVPYTAEWREFIHPRQAKAWRESGCTFNYRPNILDGYVMPFDISDDIYDEFHQVYCGGTMVSYDVDGPNTSFATQGPFLYMLARLAVHPDQKLEDIRAEWFDGFGPAAKEIGGYFDYWRKYIRDNAELFCRTPREKDPINHEMFFGWHFAFYAHILYPPESFAPAEAFIARARAAAKDSPDDLRRVEFVAVGLEHAKLCAETCAVFADKTASVEARRAAYDRVQKFRESGVLPPWAANLKNCTANMHNEAAAWVLPTMDPNRSVALPIDWRFKLDTENRGESLGYPQPDFDDSSWGMAKTDRHLERQGHPQGWLHAWFRLDYTIPEKFRGARKTVFHFGALDKTCKLWINGKLAGQFTYNPETHPNSWNLPMEFDVTRFVPADGKLSVAVQVTSLVGSGGIVKPCYLVFPDARDERIGFDAQNPPSGKLYYSYGDTCCDYRNGALRFFGGAKPKSARFVLDQLKNPGNKCLRVKVDYRRSGVGRLTFFLEEFDLNNRKIRRTPLVLTDADSFRELKKDIDVKSDAVRVNLKMESELKEGAAVEVRAMSFELLPLLTRD